MLREPEGRLDALAAEDRERLAGFARWFSRERAAVAPLGVEELIERVLERTGYDLAMLAHAGRSAAAGQRSQADAAGPRARGRRPAWTCAAFWSSCAARSSGWGGSGDSRESEAPVEGEALDAVRLMTIHRAKGLEFEIVCVADLGRGPIRRAPLIRVGRDGRVWACGWPSPGPAARSPRWPTPRWASEERELEQAGGAAAVLRRDDAGPGAPDPQRRGQVRDVADPAGAGRSAGSARRSSRTSPLACWRAPG